jgi:hypothetical protein
MLIAKITTRNARMVRMAVMELSRKQNALRL